jgi:hypothetical protein
MNGSNCSNVLSSKVRTVFIIYMCDCIHVIPHLVDVSELSMAFLMSILLSAEFVHPLCILCLKQEASRYACLTLLKSCEISCDQPGTLTLQYLGLKSRMVLK